MIQLPIDEMFYPFIVNYVLFDRMTNIYIYIYIALFDVCVHAALQIYSYTRYQQDRELFRSN